MKRPSILRLLLAALAAVIGLTAFTVTILFTVFDLHVELAGNGIYPIVSFGNTRDHFENLERNRSQHYSRLLPAGSSRSLAPLTTPSESVAASDTYWTDFRGPNRDGRYTQTPLRTTWPAAGLDPLWTQPIGGGYSSFVVAQGLAFTIEQRRNEEVVSAYDAATGREVWTHAWSAHFTETMGGPGPRATPTWHDGHLYALGATGQFWCLDAKTGAVMWNRNILHDSAATNLVWAMSASPLIVDDLVIVQPGGANGWSVIAYNHETGDILWHALDDVQGYSSPMLVSISGVRQILTVTAERAVGLRIEDGQLLWEFPWVTPTVPNMSQPIVFDEEYIFLSAGYGHGATLLNVIHTDGRYTVESVWQNNRMKNKFSSAVFHEGYIYGFDESILACIKAVTGELQWKGGRYGYGQLLLAGDHLVILSEHGDVVLVRATPERHDEVAGFVAIEGKTWNVPALAEGRLFVRNAREMAAFDLTLQ